MILKLWLNTQMIWMIFMNILKNSIQIKNAKILTVIDDTIGDLISNKKLKPIVTQLFIWGRKLIMSLVCITQSYFAVPGNIRLNFAHSFIMKILKQESQQVTHNHSSGIYFYDFMNLQKKWTVKSYYFWVSGTTLASDNHLRFGSNVLKRI